jgi:phytoene synthase
MAFQLTNILRDVGVDADDNRIYLPLDDLRACNCPEHVVLQKIHSPEFRALMRKEADRARHYYERARSAFAALPPSDRRALIVAEIMRAIYSRILGKIEQSDYRVFGPRVTLSTAHRLAVALGVWIRGSRFS